jgi:poly(3-hydroxybutyrate) depolymerase
MEAIWKITWSSALILSILFNVNVYAFDGSGAITSGGKSRSFIFHAPGTVVTTNLPLLFVFHGDGESGTSIKNLTKFNEVADAGNFLVVYPNADNDGNGWHRAIDQPKDVQFTSDMIDYFCSTYHIDSRKVYASGHSAGGFMTYNLAVNLPGRIAAFAPVAGNMYAKNGDYSYFGSSAFKAVAICHIHGDPDDTVTYPDADHTPTPWDEWPLTHFSHYTCNKDTYVPANNIAIAPNVTKITFCPPNPPSGKEICMIRVQNVGHGWPVVTGFNPAQYIWDFLKTYSISAAASCAIVPEVPTFVDGTIHTEGKNIMSPCNESFIPRGVNYSLADDWEFPGNINGDPTGVNDELSAEIIKAKPNTVRIEWFANRQASFAPYSIADLDAVVTRFENAGIVSIIDLHDLTCSNDYALFNSVILPWWKQQSVLTLLHKHKGFVIANIANEFGTVNWASVPATAYTTWLNHYKSVITQLRTAGIEVPLMIDAPDCGASLDRALQAGDALKAQDPLHNIVMSAHAYWYQDNAAAMEVRAQQIDAATFPLVLGEIANIQDATGACSNAIPAYTNLLQSCQTHHIGWLAWTWTDDQCNNRRMTQNGRFANLSAYGSTIVNDPVFGLKVSAIPMDITCLGGPLPVTLTSLNATETGENQILVSWKTVQEKDFKEFVLERSADGKRFENIASIAPGSSSGGGNGYEYRDSHLTENQYYYRLKMVDNDGSYAMSRIVSVVRKKAKNFFVFPSPAHDYIVVNSQNIVYPAKIQLLDQSGRKILTQTIRYSGHKINVASLAEGLYIVTMNNQVIAKVVVGAR